jgi:hypothetical protein
MLSIQTNKNKNCKSVGKITACKLFCKKYCFHISVGKITACKVYCSRLCSIVQCALPQSILKYSTWSYMWVSSEALPVERCQSSSTVQGFYHPLVYLKYGIGYSRLYLMLSWLLYVVFVMCNAAHNSSMWTCFYFLFLCPMPTSVLKSFAK